MTAVAGLRGFWRKVSLPGSLLAKSSSGARALLLVVASFPGQALVGVAFVFACRWLDCFAPSFLVRDFRGGESGFFGEELMASCGSALLGWLFARKASDAFLLSGSVFRSIVVRLFSAFLGFGPVLIWAKGLILLLPQFLAGFRDLEGLGPYAYCLYDPGLGLWGPFSLVALGTWVLVVAALFVVSIVRTGYHGHEQANREAALSLKASDAGQRGTSSETAASRALARFDAPVFCAASLPPALLFVLDALAGFPSAVRNIQVVVCGETLFSSSGAAVFFAGAGAFSVLGLLEVLAIGRNVFRNGVPVSAGRQLATSATAAGTWVAVMILDAATAGKLEGLAVNRLLCAAAVILLNLHLWRAREP